MIVTVKSQMSHSTRIIKRIILLFVAIASTFTTAIAQDTKQGLARPEWQLRADLEFRSACQSSLQKLCLEVIQTHQKDPSDPANSKLLSAVGELLETTDGKLPTGLPEHPASIEYVKARKAAVIEWNKAYKAKGRDLPSIAMDAERKFQETHKDVNDPLPNAMKENGKSGNVNNQSAPTASESKSSRTKRVAGNELRNAEKKLEETTIKSATSLIKEIDKYRSKKPVGDTTFERDLAKRTAREAVIRFAESQLDYYFNYPISDVSGDGKALVFSVDEPTEFEQLRQELGVDLQLINLSKSIRVENAEILKISSPIKPGDLLRVRFRVRFHSFGTAQHQNNGVNFAVSHSSALGDPSLGNGNSIFGEKTIVGFQFVKQPAKTETSP